MLVKEQELETLRQQLSAKGGEVHTTPLYRNTQLKITYTVDSYSSIHQEVLCERGQIVGHFLAQSDKIDLQLYL